LKEPPIPRPTGSGEPFPKGPARALLRRLVALRLFLRGCDLPLASGRAVLVIAPHPDDETLGMGGTIARLAAAGSVPHVAFVTDGRASHPGHPTLGPEDIAALRRREAEGALAALGVGADRVAYLGGPDGRLDRLAPDEGKRLADELRLAFRRVRPDLVFLPTRADGSSEHQGAYDLVRSVLATETGDARVLEFAVWAWWSPLRLLAPLRTSRAVWRSRLGPARAAKARAIAAYQSQCLPLPPQRTAALPAGFPASFDTATEYFFER